MRNEDTLARRRVADRLSEADGGGSRPSTRAADRDEAACGARVRRPIESSEGSATADAQRSEKIEAYLRYINMKPPAREEEPVTLRRQVAARERFAARVYEPDPGAEEPPRYSYPVRKPA